MYMKMCINGSPTLKSIWTGPQWKKCTLCHMTIPHLCFCLEEPWAHIPTTACTWFWTVAFPIIAKPGDNQSVHQTEWGWINHVKSIVCNTLQWISLVYRYSQEKCLLVTEKERCRTISEYAVWRSLYLTSPQQSKLYFLYIHIYKPLKNLEYHSIWQPEMMWDPFCCCLELGWPDVLF